MSAVTGDIVNLINGVSQQAASLRLPTQGELQENYYSTIVRGLKKRPPIEHLAKILASVPSGAHFHIIDRDEQERYVVIIQSDGIRVFDFAGNEKTVTEDNSAYGYLSSAINPAEDISVLTVADYTFIVNKKVVCAMDDTDTSPTRYNEALINIKAGNYARTYQIKINGNVAAEYATPDGSQAAHAAQIATTVIAQELYNDLVAAGYNTAPWAVGIHQNALHVLNTSGDFTISIVDGVNGNASSLAKGIVQKFADLPNFGPQDYVVEVGNSDGTTLDNYWVRADKGGSDQNSQVTWRETTKPGTVLSIDATTMPHLLVRNGDGTFTFKAAEWDKRKCGDGVDISPDPSFIGSTIEHITFHRNRLGFLTDEGIVFSRSGSYFDFFRTTATTLLDDDPIDVQSTHVRVSFLKHALPHQDYLLLFSEGTQFRLSGGDQLLTPKTVSIRPLTEFNTSPKVRPIANGPSSFFVSDTANEGAYASVFEYFIDKAVETADADHVNAHAPSYIPAGAFALTGSPDYNILALLTHGDPEAMFVYGYYWAKEEKVQSSWSRWSVSGAEILGHAFIDSYLYVLYGRSDGLHLGRMDTDPAAFDEGFGFKVALDHRVHSDALAAPSYDTNDDDTTYALPYNPGPKFLAIIVPGGEGVIGTELVIKSVTDNLVVLKGDTRNSKIIFGHTYESRYRFSPFYPRVPSQGGGAIAKQDGRLQVHHLTVVYDRSAHFRVEVRRNQGDPEVYVFNGYKLGAPDLKIGEIGIHTGRMNIPVMSKNTQVEIDLVNDSWLPSNFVSASWRGRWTQTAREV